MNLKDIILKERSKMEIGILIHLSDNADDDFRKVSERWHFDIGRA